MLSAMHGPLLLAAGAVDNWGLLQDTLLLLLAAILAGAVAERLGQSVLVGYLFAGTIVGPNVLGGVQTQDELMPIAELGVALLLFAIGLEFSPQRLLAFGRTTLNMGLLQIGLTILLGWLIGLAVGLSAAEALVVGMMISVSSTATVVRVLTDRAEIDSLHGRSAVGVLLIQDMAVIIMIVLAGAMRGAASWHSVALDLAGVVGLCIVLFGAFYALFNFAVPRLLLLPTMRRNRDLPVLMAVVMSAGSAWAAHRVGLSPALGAFTAGVLLALSPYAVQIRADTRPLATVMVTLFFAAIGMYGDPYWVMQHWGLVSSLVLAIVGGKALLVTLLSRMHRRSWRYAVAVGMSLAQVGEFSFVLASIAADSVGGQPPLISEPTFRGLVSGTIISMLLTPYLIAIAPMLGGWLERWSSRNSAGGGGIEDEAAAGSEVEPRRAEVILVGFGPAGQRVAEGMLATHSDRMVVIDLNPDNIEIAQRYGLETVLGDATRRDVLEHAGVQCAAVVVLTIPDHATVRQLVFAVRDMAPDAYIIARCRYHVLHWDLLAAGAHEVVDEELLLGQRMAELVLVRCAEAELMAGPSDASGGQRLPPPTQN